MSLVCLTSHNNKYEFRHHGLNGWAIGYLGKTRQIDRMERPLAHDLGTINNWSLWLDLKIISRTLSFAQRQTMAY